MSAITEPGIYPGRTFEEYAALPFLNNSALKWARVSMAHVRGHLDGRLKKETQSTALGKMIHAYTLEGAKAFDDRYIVEPDLSQFKLDNGKDSKSPRSTKAYSDWVASQTKAACTVEDAATMIAVAGAIRNSPDAERFMRFDLKGQNECILVWDDPLTGVRCKAMIDRLLVELKRAIDLKSTVEIERFIKDIRFRSYDFQQSFYRRGLFALTGEWFEMGLVGAEASFPMDVVAAPFLDADLAAIDVEIDRHMLSYAECLAADSWPGRGSPPHWEVRRIEAQVDEPANEGAAATW